MRTTGQFIVDFLVLNGIDRAYCVPGESFLPVLDALSESGIDTITARHESAAGFMAVADARQTGRPGVVLVSRGPGATNASIAVHTAQQDGVPLILFVGQVDRRNLRRDGFQEIDYAGMFGGIAKWTAEVADARDLPQILSRAFNTAIAGTPGPVVVSLPEDVLTDPVPASAGSMRPTRRALSHPAPQAVAQTAAMLRASSRPLLLAGMEFESERGRAVLREFAERHALPVMVSFRRHDLFPNTHPLYAGDMGVSNTPEQLSLLATADLILALGTRLGDSTTHGYTLPASPCPGQKLVHVYDDASVLGRHYRPELAVACAAPDFLEALSKQECSSAGAESRKQWAARLHDVLATQNAFTFGTRPDGVVFRNVVHELSRLAGPQTSVVLDAGISAALVYRYFPFAPPQRMFVTMAGVMGFGVPGAVSVALREPGRKVICVLGDGGFMMTGNELAIAVERRLDICVVLANNRSLGTIRYYQERDFPGRPYATALAGPDFAETAKAFGCAALRIDAEEDVRPRLAQALGMRGPVLVEVKTSLQAALPA